MHRQQAHADHAPAGTMHTFHKHYMHLAIMAVLSFAAMYILMYAMVDRFTNVYNNLNQVYMAALMAAPMVVIELLMMRSMYPNGALNTVIIAAAVAVALLCWFGIRQQWAIGDNQFLRSMISHHAGAVLMCEQAPVARGEIKSLCQEIIKSQQDEIAQMKALLAK